MGIHRHRVHTPHRLRPSRAPCHRGSRLHQPDMPLRMHHTLCTIRYQLLQPPGSLPSTISLLQSLCRSSRSDSLLYDDHGLIGTFRHTGRTGGTQCRVHDGTLFDPNGPDLTYVHADSATSTSLRPDQRDGFSTAPGRTAFRVASDDWPGWPIPMQWQGWVDREASFRGTRALESTRPDTGNPSHS